MGSAAAPGCCSVRPAPNLCGVASIGTVDNFERNCEPRGRGSLRPRGALPSMRRLITLRPVKSVLWKG